MQSSKDLKSFPGSLNPASWLIVSVMLAVMVLAVMVYASLVVHQPLGKFTRDVAAVADVHPLVGVLSNLGILLWCATATVCLFSAATMRATATGERFRVLLFAGLFSAYLLCDDLFMIHDELVPHLLRIDEKVVIAMIVLAGMVYLAVLRPVLRETNYAVFLVAIGGLAVSVLADTIFEDTVAVLGDWKHLVEDGSKWIGIVCWFSYHLHTSLAWVTAGREVPVPVAAASAAATAPRRPEPLPGVSQPLGSY